MNIRTIMFVYGTAMIYDSVNRRRKNARCCQNDPAAACLFARMILPTGHPLRQLFP